MTAQGAGAAAAAPVRIGIAGRLRIAWRIAAMACLLLACVPLFYVSRIGGGPNLWPRRFLGGVARIAGVRTRHEGEPRRQGAVLLVNHVSWIDIPALAGATGCAFVAHDGLAGVPLVRWLCAMNDTVFVARHDRRSVGAQVAQVRTALRDTGALAIFPEGTTSDGTGVLAFKSSLLSAVDPVPPGIAVQPVVLDYGADAPELAWVGEEHGLDNFLRILARRQPVRLSVRFLEPLAGEALAGRKAIAQAAQAAIADAMGRERPGVSA